MPSKSSRILTYFILALVCVAGGASAYFLFKDTSPPEVSLSPEAGPVSADTQFALTATDLESGLRAITVTAVQDDVSAVLLESVPAPKTAVSLAFELPAKTFADGDVTIRAEAVDASYYHWGKGSRTVVERTYSLDTRKPRLSILSFAHNLNRGGSGLVLYNVDEKVGQSGVAVGQEFFPGYELPDGRYAALFAFPYFVARADFLPVLTATDAAGNERRRNIPFHANNRTFRSDTIGVGDSFLDRKMIQFEDDYPDATDNLAIFLKVNREMRADNRASLKTIGRQTAHRLLFDGAFLRMPGKTMARFGDHRTYLYQGREIDRQTHLGYDLASVRNARVEAANAGDVVYTGDFGIYGLCVILDHGLGLQSLYAHLSETGVDPGQHVDKGQMIGRTGATGMAGGDHLHFSILVSGIPVNPVEWWDATWIENNISSKLAPEDAS